jgi:signal transduction histidine kinase
VGWPCAPRPPVALRADPQRLAQVLHNLLDNAARLLAPEGRRRGAGRGGRGEVRMTACATGAPASRRTSSTTIFERFVQGRRRDERGGGGSGLGLAIVRTLVGLHGGRVTVRNLPLADGGGAEFTVALPRSGPRAA